MANHIIKIKAWDKNLKGWIVERLFLSDGKVFIIRGSNLVECNADVVEWTGLTDKNGKEIYEGDIVEEKNESGTFRYKIEWDEFDCCLFPKALFKTMIQQRMSSNYTEFKIIGNIYESQELLK